MREWLLMIVGELDLAVVRKWSVKALLLDEMC
jgi:hypothetical protein